MTGLPVWQAGRSQECWMLKTLLVALVVTLCGGFSAIAMENQGAAKIALDGGQRKL